MIHTGRMSQTELEIFSYQIFQYLQSQGLRNDYFWKNPNESFSNFITTLMLKNQQIQITNNYLNNLSQILNSIQNRVEATSQKKCCGEIDFNNNSLNKNLISNENVSILNNLIMNIND